MVDLVVHQVQEQAQAVADLAARQAQEIQAQMLQNHRRQNKVQAQDLQLQEQLRKLQLFQEFQV